MIGFFILAAALQPSTAVLHSPAAPPPASPAAVQDTAAAARDAFRAWLAAEMVQCATEAQVARRRVAKVQFDLLQPRMIEVLGQQRAGDLLGDVVMNEPGMFPGCPAGDAIEQRMAEFESAVGRLSGLLFAGEMMPFRPAQ